MVSYDSRDVPISVGVVTDSVACLPPGMVAWLEIEVVPVELVLDGRAYRDGLDITPDEFYRAMAGAKSSPLHAAVMHALAPQQAEEMRQVIASRFQLVELYVTQFTPVMGVHTGPGVLGIAFYWGD